MLESFAKEMDFCTTCPRLCQSACPVAMENGNESFTPWGLMQTMNLLRKGELKLDEEIAALSYQCITCKGCTSLCEHDIEVPPILNEVRNKAVKKGVAPKSMGKFLDKFHRYSNPFGQDLLEKLKDIIPEFDFGKKYSTVYFVSCGTIKKTPEVIRDTFSLFSKLKIDFVGVYTEANQCCGYPLAVGGLEEEFIDLAEVNFHQLKKFDSIIVGSPACAYTLRETYKKYDFDLSSKITTINEFLKPYLHHINFLVTEGVDTNIMYHDPCYSSRYLDETDLTRELIGEVTGLNPVEFYHHGKKTGCSGQGGCYSVIDKDNAVKITKRRLEEVEEKGVKTLVTQCPTCVHQFRKDSKGIQVKDLVSYLNGCIDSVEGTK